MRRTLSIAIDALDEGLRNAFVPVLEVAKSRSIADWTLAPSGQADLVCRTPLDGSVTGQRGLALWFARREAAQRLGADGDVSIDPEGIRVVSVLTALDMAAVRLLQRGDQARADAAQAAPRAPSARLYRLKHWPNLAGPFASRRHFAAAALLTKRSMTREELVRACELSATEVLIFVDELHRLGALRVIDDAPVAASATPPPKQAAVRPLALLARARAWLAGAA